MVDAENTFNSINRKVMLHDLKSICQCYTCLMRLFIICGHELLSNEGTAQVDPTSVGAHSLGILPILSFLLKFISINGLNGEEVALTDDFVVASKLSAIEK